MVRQQLWGSQRCGREVALGGIRVGLKRGGPARDRAWCLAREHVDAVAERPLVISHVVGDRDRGSRAARSRTCRPRDAATDCSRSSPGRCCPRRMPRATRWDGRRPRILVRGSSSAGPVGSPGHRRDGSSAMARGLRGWLHELAFPEVGPRSAVRAAPVRNRPSER